MHAGSLGTARTLGLALAAAVILAGAAPAASAAIFTYDFESEATGADPASPPWHAPHAPGNSIVNVEDNVSHGVGAPVGNASQYLRISGSFSSDANAPYVGAVFTEPVSDGSLTVTFDANNSPGASSTSFLTSIVLSSSSDNTFTGGVGLPAHSDQNILTIFFRANSNASQGLLHWRSGTLFPVSTGLAYNFNEWDSYTLEINFGTGASGGDEFRLTNSIGSTSWITFNGPTVANSASGPIRSFYAGVTQTAQNSYVDNILVVPEPASLALLALGGAACLTRRRPQPAAA